MSPNQVATSTARFEVTEEVEKAHFEQTTGKAKSEHSAVSQSIVKTPQPSIAASGWTLTIVGMIVGVAVLVGAALILAVCLGILRKRAGKNVSGQAVTLNDLATTSQNTQANNYNGQETSCNGLKSDPDSDNMYEVIPEDAAYAASSYVFDVPQYDMVEIENSGEVKNDGVGSHDEIEDSENIYENGNH
uniref:Uncharacterized protein n=1 Tax=Branchiostoma floridae TaxID=7739 RepID=C3ZF19_BRAFL|eukprot:XP_002593314.1 hypothetical protein BRAFLDRAFT_83862 [Branchiostoma floridae]